MTRVRTRFAPSPTGLQHVGGFRTAFYSWLFAKHHGGDFLLRIEDTDRTRTVEGAISYILESLNWFGIVPDEGPSDADLESIGELPSSTASLEGPYGPYIQSLRGDRYKKIAEQLIDLGVAYRCDCTVEMLQAEREAQLARKENPGYSGHCRDRAVSAAVPHVIRLKIPDAPNLSFEDGVRGAIRWESLALKDTILLKSDGFPSYHLASVVDDYEMKITHVFRGEEWIATTPIHLMVYDALGWERPVFCHLATVLGPDGKKLSKRHGALPVTDYKEAGYLPGALLNYVTLVGWSPGDDREVLSRQELIEAFSLEGLSPSNGVFDETKLAWMNGVYIREMSNQDFTDAVKPIFETAGFKFQDSSWNDVVGFIKERTKLLPDVLEMGSFLFADSLEYNADDFHSKKVDTETQVELLRGALPLFEEAENFTVEALESTVREFADAREIKVGMLFPILRIAVTGKKNTPPLFESIVALGRERTVVRLKDALDFLQRV